MRAAWFPKSMTVPLSWSWGSYVIDASGQYVSAPLVIAAAGSHVRKLVRPDLYNTPIPDGLAISGLTEPAIGFEESFSINVTSAGAIAGSLVREFSMDGITFKPIATVGLVVNATTNTLVASGLLRFPAYPFLRYTILNNDGINAITVNFILTLRAT